MIDPPVVKVSHYIFRRNPDDGKLWYCEEHTGAFLERMPDDDWFFARVALKEAIRSIDENAHRRVADWHYAILTANGINFDR